jgi:hypothetical protein
MLPAHALHVRWQSALHNQKPYHRNSIILCLTGMGWVGGASQRVSSPLPCLPFTFTFPAAASGNRIVLLPPGVGSTQEVDAEAEQALSSALAAAAAAGLQGPGEGAPPAENQLAAWSSRQGGGIEITHR